ncbi:MAG: GT4 family glycosyltransferase PelF, partial [Candidatus Krumholzibacteriia bacterium]
MKSMFEHGARKNGSASDRAGCPRHDVPVRRRQPSATDPDAFDASGEPADVCLLLEGTYPYVTGGVSSWVHQLITSLPQFSFSLFYIGASRELDMQPRYTLPSNVVSLRRFYLFDEALPDSGRRLRGDVRRELYGRIEAMHHGIKQGRLGGELRAVFEALSGRAAEGSSPPGESGSASGRRQAGPRARARRGCPVINARNLLHDREAWELLTRLYDSYSEESSFIDYFWSIRFMHVPIWKLIAAAPNVQNARCYHAVSTGYAGLLASVVHAQRGQPLILTEHGIYTKERRIELAQAEWIHATRHQGYVPFKRPGYLKELWMKSFEFMSRLTYAAAAQIVTLHEGNRMLQIEHGAPAEKITVIPNGVDLERLSDVMENRKRASRPTVGFVGRVVPIKDVKTLVRATKIVSCRIPDVEVLVVGPTG